MKKDIIFLCQYFYPEKVSSAILPYQTARYLAQKGYKVSVLTGKSNKYNGDKKSRTKEIVDGIEIKRVRYLQFKSKGKIARIISYFSYIIKTYLKIFYIKKHQVIVVYSNPPILPKVALLAKRLFKNKIIFVSYDIYPEIAINTGAISEKSLIAKRTRKMNESLFMNVSRVIALSTEMKRFLLENRSIEDERITVIPNWHEDFKNENPIEIKLFENFKKEGDLIISYFGNLGVLQDIETIVEAAKVIKDEKIKFLFVGHGGKVKYLNDEINKYKLTNIYYKDFLSGNDFKEAIQISDIYVVSLLKEGTALAVPSKTYSYLMSGKPVISIMDVNTDISREIKEREAGFSLENGQVSDFVEIIEKIKKNRSILNLMGQNARKLYLEKYTEEINVKKYEEVIKGLLQNKVEE